MKRSCTKLCSAHPFFLTQEFGFDSNNFTGGGGSNTHYLRLHYGWTGLLMDGSHSNPGINLHMERISPDNIVHLFEKHGAAQTQSA